MDNLPSYAVLNFEDHLDYYNLSNFATISDLKMLICFKKGNIQHEKLDLM